MKNRIKLVFTCFVLFLSLQILGQKPKGNRILAWQVDLPESQLYDSSFKYAHGGCMEIVHLFYPWNVLEPANGNFDQSFMAQNLNVANIYYPTTGTQVEIQVAPINAHQKMVPTDLANVGFNDQLMIDRFKALLDTIFNHIPNIELAALNIGNESAAYLNNSSSAYAAYKVFLDSVVPYARQKYMALHGAPLKVGSTFTFHGLTSPVTSALCKTINANLDHVSVTYYPLKSDFTMQEPSVVVGDFGTLVKEYPNTPIYFAECGYSSSTFCNSSELKQARFYTEVFKAWDSFSTKISTITIFKSNDWSKHEVNGLASFYGISDTIFKEYLRTLGVRNWEGDGSNKQAYSQILCELDDRSWCGSAQCKLTNIYKPEGNKDLSIYPNPCSGILNISNDEEIAFFQILTWQGKVVMQNQYTGSIDITHFKPGFYVVLLKSKSGTQSFSLVKGTNEL